MRALPDSFYDLPTRKVEKGEFIITQGQPCGQLFFLEKGSVEILKDDVLIAEVWEQNAVFGEMSILLESTPTASVRAREDSVFRVVDKPHVYMTENPQIAYYVAEILARRLDSLNRYLVDVKSQFKENTDHIGMVDDVLDTLMTKHPRKIERREVIEP